MDFFSKAKSVLTNTLSTKKASSVKKLTTYLGTLLKEALIDPTTLPYNGTTIDYSSKPDVNPRAILGQYEAALTQTAYMSRLAYNSNMQKFPAVQLINENPIIFNTGLSLVRRHLMGTYKSQSGKSIKCQPFIGDGVVLYDKSAGHDTPCYLQIVDYTGMPAGCPYPGKKILYVAFRGTLSLKNAFLTDANVSSRNVADLLETCSMAGIKGLDAFRDFVDFQAKSAIGVSAAFGAHQGFVLNLMGMMNRVCEKVDEICQKGDIDRIIFTGHSLGAITGWLASFVIAGFKRAGVASLQKPTLHCINFGAPKGVMDYTRNIFNKLLDDGYITFDRVANRMENLVIGLASAGIAMDLVPTIPPNFVHPGYSILKHEIKTQSKTGRSKNITDIRQMYGAIEPGGSGILTKYSEFNGLPAYKEFLACFSNPMYDTYEKLISYLPFGTIYPIVGKKQATYDYVKNMVSSIFQEPVEDISEAGAIQEAQKEKEGLQVSTAGLSEEVEENPTAPEQPLNNNPRNPQNGGGAQKNIYTSATMKNGPNHIVYSCRKNIGPFTCHLTYMGISYNGVSIDSVGYTPPPISFFKVDKATSKMTYIIPEGNTMRQNMSKPNQPVIGGRRRKTKRKVVARKTYKRRSH